MRSATALLLVLAGLAGGALWFNYHRAESAAPDPPNGSYTVEMNVMSGEGHQPFIQMPHSIKLTLSRTPYEGFTGPAPFVEVRGNTSSDFYKDTITGEWDFVLSGNGTVAGYENVSVTFTGHFDNGALTGVYTMGADNELPGGYAIEYRVKNSTIPATYTRTPTATPTVTATPTYDFCVIAGGACPPLGTPTATPPVIATATPPATQPPAGGDGDVNKDGTVNAIDATLVLQAAAGLTALQHADNADVNQDGQVNAIDATLVLQLGAGLIPALPV